MSCYCINILLDDYLLRWKQELFKLLCIKIIDVKRIIILAQIFGYNAMGRYNCLESMERLGYKRKSVQFFFTSDGHN